MNKKTTKISIKITMKKFNQFPVRKTKDYHISLKKMQIVK